MAGSEEVLHEVHAFESRLERTLDLFGTRVEGAIKELAQEIRTSTNGADRKGRRNGNGLAVLIPTLAALLSPAYIILKVMADNQSKSNESLSVKINDSHSTVVEHGSRLESFREKLTEIETQFAWAADARNLMMQDLYTTDALLWREVFKAPLPPQDYWPLSQGRKGDGQ